MEINRAFNRPTGLTQRKPLSKKVDGESAYRDFEQEIHPQVKQETTAPEPRATALPHVSQAGLSGEDYVKLHQESAAANRRAEQNGGCQHKALCAGVVDKELPQAYKTPSPAEGGIEILPTDSVQVKLEKLQKIGEVSDYSGMSYEEIYTTIWNRYNDAFDGRLSAILAFGAPNWENWTAISNQFGEESRREVFFDLRDEIVRQGAQRDELGDHPEYIKRVSDIKSAPLGYQGMSIEEKEAAILQKFQGKTSFLDFMSMQGELEDAMVFRKSMGMDAEFRYLCNLRDSLNAHFGGDRYIQTSIPLNDLSTSAWESVLRSDFEPIGFFIGMKDSLNHITFSNYSYDVKGMMEQQIDHMLDLLAKQRS